MATLASDEALEAEDRMDLMVEIGGWLGTAALLAAYALLSRGVLDGRSGRYQALNVVGSVLVGLNSLAHGAWPSVIINVVWLLIGGMALAALVRARA